MKQALLKVWTRYLSSLPFLYLCRSTPIFFFLCVATTSVAGVIDVRNYGAIPNDFKDDTAAIQKAIDVSPNDSTIYFPRGVYLLSDVQINNRRGLTLLGDGSTLSILRHYGRYASIFQSHRSTDILVTKLGFDVNGVASFGGFIFYGAKRIIITKTHFFDSNKQPIKNQDRFSWIFGQGTVPSEDILISDNLVEDLQLEVDFSARVRIEGNTIVRPVATAGIGVFILADNTSAREYTIQNNTIIDPVVSAAGITVHLDPPRSSHSTLKTFRILGNHIVYTKDISADHASAIRIGTGDNSQATKGNVFDDIVIQNNVIYKDPGSRYDFFHAIILGNSSTVANFRFDNTNVSNNVIFYNNRFGTPSIDIRQKGVKYSEGNNLTKGISADIMPPSVPTALTETDVSNDQVHLAWNTSVDNIGVDGYRIYRNGSSHTYSAATSYVDRNLQSGVSYTYTVTAIDENGNESSQSHPVTARTTAMVTSNPGSAPTVTRPILTATPASIPRGGRLTATWNGISSPRPNAWIGLYKPGAPNTSYLDWVYVSCSKTPGSPRASGSCARAVPASLPPGNYQLRLFGDGFTALATSNGFGVAGPNLTASPTSISSRGTLTAAWNGASSTPRDWIGLYKSGAPNASYLDWVYVSCSKTPGSSRASGSCVRAVPASLPPGNYELRLFTDGFTSLAISNPIVLGQAETQ